MADRRDVQSMTDGELVAACGKGDDRAWREVVRRHGRLIYGIASAYRLQPADADEAFQRTFELLLRSLHRLREPERLESWLVTCARRTAGRMLLEERRRHRMGEKLERELVDARWIEAADHDTERIRDGERLRHAVEQISEPCRSIIRALFSEPRRPYRQVAAELGLAVGSLGPIRGRCLERLRRLLREIPAGDRPGVPTQHGPSKSRRLAPSKEDS